MDTRRLEELFDAFALKRICRDRPPQSTPEWNNSNDFYGIAGVLKAKALLPPGYALRGTVSHGHFMEYAWDVELAAPLPVMFVMDQCYARYLGTRTAKLALALGPYVHYAPLPYATDAANKLKEQLGNTLLVFPPHSTHHIDSCFEHEFLLKAIAPLRKKYESILVMIYWKDALQGRAGQYAKAGLIPVSAGHMYDNSFLSRLRGVMELADAAFFMGRGSQIPFWMTFGKPMYYAEPGNSLHFVAGAGHSGDIAMVSTERDHFIAALAKSFGSDVHWTDKNWNSTALAPFSEQCGLNSLRQPWELRAMLLVAEALHQSWQPGAPLPLAKVAGAFLAEGRHAEAGLLYKELWLREGNEKWQSMATECLAHLCPARPCLALNPHPGWKLGPEWAVLANTEEAGASCYPLEWGALPLPDGAAKLLLLNPLNTEDTPSAPSALRDAARAVNGVAFCPLPSTCAQLPPALHELIFAAAQGGMSAASIERINKVAAMLHADANQVLPLMKAAELLVHAGADVSAMRTNLSGLPQRAEAFLKQHGYICLWSVIGQKRK